MLNWNKSSAVRKIRKEGREPFNKRERERPFVARRPFAPDEGATPANIAQRMVSWGIYCLLVPLYSVLFYFCMIGLEAGMGYSFSLSPFPIQRIEVLNNMILEKSDYLKAMKVTTQENLMECSLEDYRQRILSLRNVTDVEIKKVFPGTLKVWVKERLPVFRMSLGGELIAEDGKEVLVDEGYFKFPYLPVLSGIEFKQESGIDASFMQRFDQILIWHKKINDSKNRLEVKKYHLRTEGLEVVLNQDVVLLLPYSYNEILMKKMLAVLKESKKNLQGGGLINLLFNDVFVTKV